MRLAPALVVFVASLSAQAQPCVSCWDSSCQELESYLKACIKTRPPEPPGMGTLVVDATPPASVSIDGRNAGSTPVQQTLRRGRYELVLRRDALVVKRSIVVVGGRTVRVTIPMHDRFPGPSLSGLARSSLSVLERVRFERGGSLPSAGAEPVLDALTDVLKANAKLVLEVKGEAVSPTGEAGAELALDRAIVVREALVQRGVERDRLAVNGQTARTDGEDQVRFVLYER